MRTTFFFFAMLVSIAANATVTVTPLSTDYGTKKVTFKVAWTNSPTAPYNNRVWVWVDLCPVAGTSPGTFAQAIISGAAAVSGNIATVSGNTRGFYVTTNPSTVTATLSNATGKFNWCVYGSDYPPNVTFDEGTYTFKGTTNFIISNPAKTLTTKTIAKANLTVTSSTTFTDATGCPGIGSLYCPYTESDLYMDAMHLCQQRTSGAKNWEAWIKDSRDDELYRIVLMPDTKWWLAQNVKYAGAGTAISGCSKDECGRFYTWAQVYASYAGGTSGSSGNVQGICPPRWMLPVTSDWTAMTQNMGSDQLICRNLRALNSTCMPVPDTYGWANKIGVCNGDMLSPSSAWYANDANREDGLMIDNDGYVYKCDAVYKHGLATQHPANVRCFRQL